MPKQRDLKKLIRARSEKTGESYTEARRNLLVKKDLNLGKPRVAFGAWLSAQWRRWDHVGVLAAAWAETCAAQPKLLMGNADAVFETIQRYIAQDYARKPFEAALKLAVLEFEPIYKFPCVVQGGECVLADGHADGHQRSDGARWNVEQGLVEKGTLRRSRLTEKDPWAFRLPLKCEHQSCDEPASEYCHASCCQGETALCSEHSHFEQYRRDEFGIESPIFKTLVKKSC